MPFPIAAVIGALATIYAAKKAQEAQSEGSRNAAAGQAGVGEGGDMFGGNTLEGMLENTREGTSVAPYQAGPARMSAPPPVLPPIADIALPQGFTMPPMPQQPPQATTYSQGVKAQNIAPPTGGSTGGEVSAGEKSLLGAPSPGVAWDNANLDQGTTPLGSGPPEWQGPPMPYEPQGPPMPYEPQGPPLPPGMGPMGAIGGDQRLQEIMGIAGPAAGMIGAAAGARGRGAPGSGGFPARPFHMPLSLASLPPRRRY